MAEERKGVVTFFAGLGIGVLSTLFVTKVLVPSKTELTVTEDGREVMKVVQAQIR